MRFITESYHNKIRSIIENGGTLWIVERVDTHQFAFETRLYNPTRLPNSRLDWHDTLDIDRPGGEYYIYLTKEDFDKDKLILRDGGCEYCGRGGIKIPIICIEHEFANKET